MRTIHGCYSAMGYRTVTSSQVLASATSLISLVGDLYQVSRFPRFHPWTGDQPKINLKLRKETSGFVDRMFKS